MTTPDDTEREERRRARRARRGEGAARDRDPADGITALSWVAGIAVAVWCCLLDWPGGSARAAALALPPLALAVEIGWSIAITRTAIEPHVLARLAGAVIPSGIGLFFAVTSRYNFLDGYWPDASVFLSGLVLILIGIALASTKKGPSPLEGRVWIAAFAIVAVLGYLDAAMKQFDVWLDTSTPRVYRPTVLGKRHEYRRREGLKFYVTLSTWGPTERSQEEEVSEAFYDRAEDGMHVCATVHDGYFAIRYFSIDFCS
jgi:hypothetical protein